VAARCGPGHRYALRDSELAVHPTGGTTERRVLASVAALRETLTSVFRIELPEAAELDAVLARVLARGETAKAAGAAP
jgi:arylamine N-acetyltransferase